MIAIIDYGAGNLKSVENALRYLGINPKITSDPEEIEKAEKLILPGVGSFGFMMKSLEERGLDKAIKQFIKSGKPFLGICLGLQALFEKSEESPGVKGLGIFKGEVVRFSKGKVPQIGWNKIMPVKEISAKNNIFQECYVYFVNSFYVVPEQKEIIALTTDYNKLFVSAILYENVTAVQFHPEKSGEFGLEILRRWSKC
ncbi:MAG: imidazole glycerol phosphate synthase subunit HisH [Candidatus Woesearchaeota archaeon]